MRRFGIALLVLICCRVAGAQTPSDSSGAGAKYDAGMAAYNASRYSEAESFLRQALDLAPQNVTYNKALVYALWAQNHFADAVPAARMIAQLQATASNYYIYANVLHHAGRESEANTVAILGEGLIRSSPGIESDGVARNKLADFLEIQLRFEEAVAETREAVRLGYGQGFLDFIYYWLAQLLAALGRFDEAETAISQAIALGNAGPNAALYSSYSDKIKARQIPARTDLVSAASAEAAGFIVSKLDNSQPLAAAAPVTAAPVTAAPESRAAEQWGQWRFVRGDKPVQFRLALERIEDRTAQGHIHVVRVQFRVNSKDGIYRCGADCGGYYFWSAFEYDESSSHYLKQFSYLITTSANDKVFTLDQPIRLRLGVGDARAVTAWDADSGWPVIRWTDGRVEPLTSWYDACVDHYFRSAPNDHRCDALKRTTPIELL